MHRRIGAGTGNPAVGVGEIVRQGEVERSGALLEPAGQAERFRAIVPPRGDPVVARIVGRVVVVEISERAAGTESLRHQQRRALGAPPAGGEVGLARAQAATTHRDAAPLALVPSRDEMDDATPRRLEAERRRATIDLDPRQRLDRQIRDLDDSVLRRVERHAVEVHRHLARGRAANRHRAEGADASELTNVNAHRARQEIAHHAQASIRAPHVVRAREAGAQAEIPIGARARAGNVHRRQCQDGVRVSRCPLGLGARAARRAQRRGQNDPSRKPGAHRRSPASRVLRRDAAGVAKSGRAKTRTPFPGSGKGEVRPLPLSPRRVTGIRFGQVSWLKALSPLPPSRSRDQWLMGVAARLSQ